MPVVANKGSRPESLSFRGISNKDGLEASIDVPHWKAEDDKGTR